MVRVNSEKLFEKDSSTKLSLRAHRAYGPGDGSIFTTKHLHHNRFVLKMPEKKIFMTQDDEARRTKTSFDPEYVKAVLDRQKQKQSRNEYQQMVES
jgi:hypothetical protein